MPPHGISHSMGGGHIDYVQTFDSKFSFSHEISSDFQKYKHDFMVTYAQERKNTLLPPVEVQMWLEHLQQVDLNHRRGAVGYAPLGAQVFYIKVTNYLIL